MNDLTRAIDETVALKWRATAGTIEVSLSGHPWRKGILNRERGVLEVPPAFYTVRRTQRGSPYSSGSYGGESWIDTSRPESDWTQDVTTVEPAVEVPLTPEMLAALVQGVITTDPVEVVAVKYAATSEKWRPVIFLEAEGVVVARWDSTTATWAKDGPSETRWRYLVKHSRTACPVSPAGAAKVAAAGFILVA